MEIVAQLAGIPYNTIASWLYKRGEKRRSATTRAKAECLATALRVPFERLWEASIPFNPQP